MHLRILNVWLFNIKRKEEMGNLAGKTALISSAGQGIGQEIAAELIRRGCNIVVSYLSSSQGADEIVKLARKNNLKAYAVKADLTRENDCRILVRKTVDYLGSIDILVNNAGSLVERRELEQVDVAFWEKVIAINMSSMMMLTREALPYLKANSTGASIINLSSLAGRKGGHGGSLVYATSKGAVLTWTRALSAELGPFGIRVNALAPGLILGTSFHDTHTTKESAQNTISQIPLGRAGSPADVARAAAFLASEYDGFITGATLDINGGVYCA
jgi:3-oxoacyl-[acyl-carrier protein] reductase